MKVKLQNISIVLINAQFCFCNILGKTMQWDIKLNIITIFNHFRALRGNLPYLCPFPFYLFPYLCFSVVSKNNNKSSIPLLHLVYICSIIIMYGLILALKKYRKISVL